MIVTFEWPIKTQSGINPERTIVYRSCREDSVCIASVYVCPRITEHNHRQGSKLKQANILYKSINEGFKEDLRIYADAFRRQLCEEKKLPPHQYQIFIKALCNGAVKIGDLDSLGKFVGLFGNTIEAWIANGLLPKVKAKFVGVEAWIGEGLGVRSEGLGVRSEGLEVRSERLGVRSERLGVRSEGLGVTLMTIRTHQGAFLRYLLFLQLLAPVCFEDG